MRRCLDILTATFAVRQLQPWHENIGRRQVKVPRIYLRDSGIRHTLLGLKSAYGRESHPKVGASWEGFALENVSRWIGAQPEECYFWRTHTGAELDLLVVRGPTRLGYGFMRSDAPGVTPSMRSALHDLKLHSPDVVHAGALTDPLGPKIRAVALSRLLIDLKSGAR